MRFKLYLFPITIALGVSSCADLPRPQASEISKGGDIPEHFDASKSPTPEVAKGLRTLFADRKLNDYVSAALRSNPSLKLSLANLEEAGFDIRSTYADKVPSLTGSSSISRSDIGSGASASYDISLDASWEIDVWGRIRSGVRAAKQTEAAIAADYVSAKESIAAQTMQAYFSLVADERLLSLSERRLKSFEDTVALVDRRFVAGTGNLSDVDLAKTDVETTKAQVEERKNARDQSARRLSVLTGAYPKANLTSGEWPSLRRGVPAGIPSEVMLHRPDIQAAYWRILAADSNVKIAHTELYPQFTLTGSLGQSSDVLQSLADSGFNVWSIVAGVTGPIFDGGERRAELGAANARAKQALASYRSTVLDAFEEVENALGSEKYLLRQESSYRKALNAARSAETRTLQNYENGLVEILTLLDAQRRSFITEEQLINITALRYQNRVSLALALGKGL